MLKSLKVILVAVAIATGLSSCLDNEENDTIRKDTIVGCFASVENVADHQVYGFSGLSYVISLNYTKGTAEVTINDFKLPDNKSYSSVKLADLKFQINKEGWVEISSTSAQAEVDGMATPMAFSAVDIRLCDRMTSEGRIPGFYARYNVEGYSVLSAIARQLQFGTTTSNSAAVGKYETNSTDYVLGFNAEVGTVNILMKNCRFVEKMPAMNILLEKVPFTVSGTTASFNIEEIIPKIGDTPYPGFILRNLSGAYDFSSGFAMNFKCNPETMPLDFTVSVDCKYSFTK